MAEYGPFEARVGILQRAPHFVDLIARTQIDVKALRLWGARTMDDAYGDPTGSGVGGTGCTRMLEAHRGDIARSASVVRRGAGMVEESRKGQTSFQFDIHDFIAPAATPPFGSDDDYLFLRIQESRVSRGGWVTVPATAPLNAGDPIQGPILIVPPAKFYAAPGAALTFSGTAPGGTRCLATQPPVIDTAMQAPPPLHIVLPRPALSVQVRNIDSSEGVLLVSYGLGMPMTEVAPWRDILMGGTPGLSEIVLASASGSVGGSSIGGTGCRYSVEVMVDLLGWGN